MAIEDPISISFPVIKLRQPMGEFFIGRMGWRDLCKIADFDVRRMIRERDVETYLGIQRPLNRKRVDEIGRYVNTQDATFPTGIIISVDGACASVDDTESKMTLSNHMDVGENDEPVYFRHIAKVLDGQHRIAALLEFKGGDDDYDLNVTIFVDIDIADQANVFSTVNLAQVKINRSLAYDLFALAKSRSPQKSCHNIAIALDRTENSPFHLRIKRLGVATEGRFNETITQATFVQSLLRYITNSPMEDRDNLIRGIGIPLADADQLDKLIFRNMFLQEKDLEVGDILWNFFEAVKNRWPKAWDSFGKGNVLNRTNGFKALMRFLRPAYLHCTSPGGAVTTDEFTDVLKKIDINDEEFNIETFKPGTSGESLLYSTFLSKSGLD